VPRFRPLSAAVRSLYGKKSQNARVSVNILIFILISSETPKSVYNGEVQTIKISYYNLQVGDTILSGSDGNLYTVRAVSEYEGISLKPVGKGKPAKIWSDPGCAFALVVIA